ncbi:MAG TPA: copper chaperone PCu(A)C [Anaerolineales bacterium]|nr:copper chaperone PCu(A)C [Anaerolineales bacterium]
MKKLLSLISIGLFFLVSACNLEAGIEAHQAWMRPVAKGENGAVYLILHNHSSEAEELIGASSEVAEAAEIHESIMEGDVMQMTRRESVLLEPSAEVKFEPGGLHIMLINLKQDLKTGDSIEVTLHFKAHEDITIVVHVSNQAIEEEHSHDE